MKPVIIGDAQLWLGDCAPLLEVAPPDAVVITDPPFGLGKKLAGGSWGATSEHKNVLEWDEFAPETIVQKLIHRHAVCVVWGGNYFALPPSRGWLSWFKPDAPPSMANFELAWTSLDRNSRQLSISIAATNAERIGHPTQKPLPLMAWCIEQVRADNTIFDPFMGSGTTGVAAIQLGRKFIGIERDPAYFEIAVKRIEQAVAQGQLFAPEPAPLPVQESLL